MERDITGKLLEWKDSTDRKPLLITGVRQCGKTTTMKDFGEHNFEFVSYFNLEKQPSLHSIFEGDLNTEYLIEQLGIFDGKPIIPGKTLLILDEIQACSKAITSIKYFCEDMPQLHIVCAGSLLGVMLKQQETSFPVGKSDHLKMYPMNFSEFLKAQNRTLYNLIESNLKKGQMIPESYSHALESVLKLYYIIGGMPEVVDIWLKTKDIQKVEKKQEQILLDYSNDFSKHAPREEFPNLTLIWDSIPAQLAEENSKFFFSRVKPGGRARDLENAITWLIDAGLVHKVTETGHIEKPLSSCENSANYKLYMSDVGLMRKKAGVAPQIVLNDDESYRKFKGAITENYVLNELLSLDKKPYYWRSGNTAELDFVIEDLGEIVPIEVKSATNTRAKSYGIFCKKYRPNIGFKFSLKNIGDHTVDSTKTYSVPLYLVWKINDYLEPELQVDMVKGLDLYISSIVDQIENTVKKS